MIKQYSNYWFSLIYLLLAVLVICFFDGSGDSGDSIQHYLISHYAFKHPALFFDHWGKPVFVLLSAPFAQLGFVGIKLFNVLVTLASLLLTMRVAKSLQFSEHWLAGLLMLAAPYHFVLIFSGLTEPLFGLFLILPIYLVLCKKQWLWAVIVLSFMPFVRSEGMIICGVFGLYVLWRRDWYLLPVFLVGHVVYMIFGGIVLGDFFWIWNDNPYRSLHRYIEGQEAHLLDFAERLNYVIGIPIYGLLILGVVSYLWKSYTVKFPYRKEEVWLLLGCFFAFFIAHSLFWYIGVFGSMGLKRVLVGMMPVIALIALRGFHFIQYLAREREAGKQFLFYGIIVYVLVFPFTSNPAAIDWPEDMSLQADQRLANDVAEYLSTSDLLSDKTTFYYTHPHLSLVLNEDHYDPSRRQMIGQVRTQALKSEDIVIWDQWFAVIDNHLPLDTLLANYPVEVVKNFQNEDFRYVILKKSKKK